MNKLFDVGWFAIPKKNNGHGEFSKGDVGKRFLITSIKECRFSRIGPGADCLACPGRPYVKHGSKSIKLCGYGSPESNFDFTKGDWDE